MTGSIKRVVGAVVGPLKDSPAIWLSLICCSCAYARIVIPLIVKSAGSASIIELTLVTFFGALLALIALRRDREQAWYLSPVLMVLNGAAWCFALMQFDWAYIFYS
jgi:hypothetical protein